MADLRIPPPSPSTLPARPLPASRAETVRAAQRAFFETALAGDAQATPSASPARAATAAAAAPAPVEVRAALDPGAPPPSRLLRPGSLLDIKV